MVVHVLFAYMIIILMQCVVILMVAEAGVAKMLNGMEEARNNKRLN